MSITAEKLDEIMHDPKVTDDEKFLIAYMSSERLKYGMALLGMRGPEEFFIKMIYDHLDGDHLLFGCEVKPNLWAEFESVCKGNKSTISGYQISKLFFDFRKLETSLSTIEIFPVYYKLGVVEKQFSEFSQEKGLFGRRYEPKKTYADVMRIARKILRYYESVLDDLTQPEPSINIGGIDLTGGVNKVYAEIINSARVAVKNNLGINMPARIEPEMYIRDNIHAKLLLAIEHNDASSYKECLEQLGPAYEKGVSKYLKTVDFPK